MLPADSRERKKVSDSFLQTGFNPSFQVTEEEIELALQRVEILKEITQNACKEKIKEYSKYFEDKK